jgi:NAD(P)-dependent dehydrogenase (short-subunit alcohol dehydrogenase family)
MVGDSMAGGFTTTTPETMRHVLGSKFWANWTISRHAAQVLGEGSSLTFTSGTGGRPHEISATYVANLGLGALVQGLAVELAPRTRVNAVAPTFMGTATAFWKDVAAEELRRQEAAFGEHVPLRRVATVSEVAATYVHLIANSFITGQTVAVDGGVMLTV